MYRNKIRKVWNNIGVLLSVILSREVPPTRNGTYYLTPSENSVRVKSSSFSLPLPCYSVRPVNYTEIVLLKVLVVEDSRGVPSDFCPGGSG